MKKAFKIYGMLLATLTGLLPGSVQMRAQSFEALWKQVEEAQEKSLPQTVVKLADSIFKKGLAERNAPQMFKAYLCRAAYQEQLTPDSLYSRLSQLEQWALREQNSVNKAILHSMLAEEYARYVNRNRFKLKTRTDLAEEEIPTDIREWTMNLFLSRIDAHCLSALQERKKLMETSTRDYVPFVELEEGSRFYGHDLYHLLARRAVEAYHKAWDETDAWAKRRIESIYDGMIEAYSHRKGAEEAVLMVHLDALDEKGKMDAESYLEALESLINTYGEQPLCAEAYFRKAKYLCENKRVTEALQVCEDGIKRYASYQRINELKNLESQMLQPDLSVNMQEEAYPGDSLKINVHYCQLDGFTVRLYRTNLSEAPRTGSVLDKNFTTKQLQEISDFHFTLSPLPKAEILEEDWKYQPSDTTFYLPVPETLGVFAVQIVPDGWAEKSLNNYLTTTRFKVLTMALPDNRMELVTLDARSGHPVEGVTVSFYTSNEETERKLLTEVITDANGHGALEWNKNIRYYAARKGEDKSMGLQSVYWRRTSGSNKEAVKEHVTLLTDRSLYRPGQTIYLKGVAYEQAGDSAHVLEGKTYQLQLLDANRKEVSKCTVQTNEYGSFATEFALPTACLNGAFQIKADKAGAVSVRVEEYKRPSFELSFYPVKQAYRLGDTVEVMGNVKSYSGIAVQEVPVSYTIVRSSRRYQWKSQEEVLKADTLQVDDEGNFSIPIALLSDAEDDAFPNNHYYFRIEASVTNESGETQTATFSLEASAEAYFFSDDFKGKDVCKEDSISSVLRVLNANNELLDVRGICRLYPVIDEKNGKLGANPVYEGTFISGERKTFDEWKPLPSGSYRLVLSVNDADGKLVSQSEEAASEFMLFSLTDRRIPVFREDFIYEKNVEFDAGHPAEFYYGTSYKDTYILVDVFGKGKRWSHYAIILSDTIVRMEYPYKEEYGGGLDVLLTFVKNGQVAHRKVEIRMRKPERTLDMKWEVFRDHLRPGQDEEWKLVVKTPQGLPAAAEVLAALYDASLDNICKHHQSLRLLYPSYFIGYNRWTAGTNIKRYYTTNFSYKYLQVPEWAFDRFYQPAACFVEELSARPMLTRSNAEIRFKESKAISMDDEAVAEDAEELPSVDVRTDFSETAFFYPQLRTNESGEVVFAFTMPESLTRWNFRSYSHTQKMETGMLEASIVTAKEFMITPNMPRFVRVGDCTQIAGSLANLTGKEVNGTVTFTLFDPMTEKVISVQHQKFMVESGKTIAVLFSFEVPEAYDLLGVRMIADGGAFSDGEQHLLPVLSNKVYLTETLAMSVRGKGTRTFALDSLFNRQQASAIRRRLSVEFTGNPAWYAVQALPSIQQTSGNAISWATTYYANQLAGFIVDSHPRIKAVFDGWKTSGGNKEAFLSQLEKNQEVKNILLAESPWVMEATSEAEQRARMATLFDVNQMKNRNLSALTKLKELQGENGSWSWFKGMQGSRHITAYITELLVRLPLMTQKALPSEAMALQKSAFGYLHEKALEECKSLCKSGTKEGKGILSESAMEYLYLIALSGEEIPAANRKAYDYFLSKVENNLKSGTIMRKAQSAIILKAAGRTKAADEFIASLKEHLVQTDEMGAYFAFNERPYRWEMLPVSIHVRAMEALNSAGGNEELVEEMKIWLMKQKQTTCWSSPVATADAVYALLCRGNDWLENGGEVHITLGKEEVVTSSSAGFGYVKKTFSEGSSALKAKSVVVEKRDEGMAWGAVYAQYLSPLADVRQYGKELSVEKKLYVERIAADGSKTLQPLSDVSSLFVGEKIVARLTLRLDRAMDFVQLKDQRGACFEPINSLSGYRWGNGLGYYQEVEDAATNFFFDHLNKGVYILEHSYRIARGGVYETGVATIQCAYAPEYASHSSGGTIEAK